MTAGSLWSSQFQGDEDNIRKVLYGSWLWRDWNFDTTSLTGFTPFNQSDGNLISTLFSSTNPGGPWYDPGYLDEKGPSFNQKITTVPTQVMQSRWAARYDYTKESEEISGTLMESNPIVDALHNNQPLSSLQTIGQVGYSTATPVELDIRWRQCIFIGVDGRSGLNYYVVRIYPRVVITDYGNTPWNVDKAAALPIKAMAVPDPYSTPPDGVTVGSPRWILRDGPAWRAQGESAFETVAPVATAITGLKATLAFTTPGGLVAPITYTAQQQLTSGGSFTSSTLLSTSGVVSGSTTTLTATTLTASTSYNAFKVTATDTNSVSVTSAPSNSITSTAS